MGQRRQSQKNVELTEDHVCNNAIAPLWFVSCYIPRNYFLSIYHKWTLGKKIVRQVTNLVSEKENYEINIIEVMV